MSAILATLAAPALPLAAGLVALLRRRGHAWLRGLGWVALWSAPAAVVQVALAAGPGSGEPAIELPLVLLTSWWVLTGGGLCAWFFESSLAAGEVARQSTMVDHAGYLVGLVALWSGALALVAGALLVPRAEPAVTGAAGEGADAAPEGARAGGGGVRAGLGEVPRSAWVMGVVVLLNAAAAIAWPWWGN